MLAIFKKELRSYFITPIGYVYIGVFLATAAFLCCYTTIYAATYQTSTYFLFLMISFIVLIPILTMRLFAEEKKLRTEQLLLTAPVSIWGMVGGKFLAAATLFVSSVLVSCVNFIPLYVYAKNETMSSEFGSSIRIGPETGELLACVLGIILVGLAFIAIGMFISSLTENQLAAAVITVAVIVVMIMLDFVKDFINVYAIKFIIQWVCLMSRYGNFTQGLLDYSAILYYISITGVFMLLTVRVYDKRRWS